MSQTAPDAGGIAHGRGSCRCPSCGSVATEVFFELHGVPTNSCILLETREQAIGYPRGDITLTFCRSCGFIFNSSFDPGLTEYSGRYEETQSFSATFNTFHRRQAQRLIDRYGLRNKDVLEIGCGKGEFLALLAELGDNRGIGFDPGHDDDRLPAEVSRRVTVIKDFYSEKYAHHKADLVCCKMTLEHIQPVAQFVNTVRRGIGSRYDSVVFFQIPDVTRIVRDCAFEDIYYEHCSYFSRGSLARLFRGSGFDVLNLETEYGDQYLTIEARPVPGALGSPLTNEDDLDSIAGHVLAFPMKCRAKLGEWRRRLRSARTSGRRVVLWGSGSKAVSFLSSVGDGESIEYAVDINPYRHGHFIPATGQRIVAPAFLKEYRPDVVIIMNAMYRDEITRDLDDLGVKPEIVTL